MTKKILSVLAGAALLTTGLAFAQAGATGGQGMGPGRKQARQPGQRIARYLQLTPEQRQQFQRIHQEARTQSQPYVEQLKTAFMEIQNMVKSGAAPEAVGARAEQLVAANQTAIQHLAGIRARTAARAYAVLTPEQRQKAANLRGFMGGGLGGMYPGFGMGHGFGAGRRGGPRPGPGPAQAPQPAPGQ